MEKTAAFLPADLNRLRRESGMIQATIESLSEEEMRAPSLCEGWTRAHVVAHLARGADAFSNLIEWAVTGQEKAAYTSKEDRDRAIEEGAQRSADELKADYRDASDRFLKAAESLRDGVQVDQVKLRDRSINAYALPAMRISEIIIHHLDLDTLWELHEADIDALEDALELYVGRANDEGNWPGLTFDTSEGDHFVIGDGATVIKGERDAVLGWFMRGLTDHLKYEGELPERPKF